MELIFELILGLLGYLPQFLLEIFAQATFELLAELGFRSLAEPLRRPKPSSPLMAAFGYLLYGAIAGGLSLLLPHMFDIPKSFRIANLIITPIVCGYIMATIGKYRTRRGNETIRLETFVYGYLFALAMAGVRFIWR